MMKKVLLFLILFAPATVLALLNQAQHTCCRVLVDFDLTGRVPLQSGKDLFSETMDQLMSMLNPSAQSQSDYGIFSSSKDILNLGMWYAALSKYDAAGWDQEKY